jgi:Domain of Unknown Function (DUF1259)
MIALRATSTRSRASSVSLWIILAMAACGFGDGDKPVGVAPLESPAGVVLHDDFSTASDAWETVAGTWAARDTDGRRVFAQTAVDQDFPLALRREPILADLDVRVRFRPLSGRTDASGGIAFRARSGRDYYVVRANALEGNFRLYRVEGGSRKQIASTRIEAPTLANWHEMRVVAIGDHIQASLDGELLLDHRDAAYASGRIGLWTKADSVTEFDDLEIRGSAEASSAPPVSAAPALDAGAIGRAAGVPATATPDGVVRVGWSRSDVPVTVDGARLDPAAGLGSWAAFQVAPGGAMMMGDTVLFEDELSPALDAALAAGLEVTAIHNHFVFDTPHVLFMHVGGHGDPAALAGSVKRVWDAVRSVRAKRAVPAAGFGGAAPTSGTLDAAALAAAIGSTPAVQGSVVKFTIGREVRMHGVTSGAAMGVNTWAAFSGSDAHASVDGDVVMTAAEVQPVLRALRKAEIAVVALHNHMLEEDPRLFFVHYWGKGAALDLARGVRAALDAQASSSAPR